MARTPGIGLGDAGSTPATRMKPQRAVAVVGDPGAGKTSLIDRLALRLGWQTLAIDEYRKSGRDWPHLIRDLRRLDKPAFVESVLLSGEFRWVLARHDSRLLHVVCEESVRLQRVAHTPWAGLEPMVQDFRWRALMKVDATLPLTDHDVLEVLDWCIA